MIFASLYEFLLLGVNGKTKENENVEEERLEKTYKQTTLFLKGLSGKNWITAMLKDR
jgi:hypothetical protein